MHKSLEYNEGYQAYLDGESKGCNPYKYNAEEDHRDNEDDADKYDDWNEGYFQAWEDEDTKDY